MGVVHPRLFVSDRFFDALSTGERQAVLDHEAGHLRSLDNLKRIVLKLLPDWLSFMPAGRALEAAWAVAAEENADDYAAAGDRARSLDLAGALLKASRAMPVGCAAVSHFCDGATIARRVARLLDDRPPRRARIRSMAPRILGILAAVGVTALVAGPAIRAAYATAEAAIQLLQ